MGAPVEELEPLEDPRRGNAGRHSLHDILVIALCTILCGGKCAPAWPSLDCPKGSSWNPSCRCELESPVMTPSPGCSGFRIREEFQKWFLGFMRQFAQGCEGVPAVDGKDAAPLL